jgi:hypothetical protein
MSGKLTNGRWVFDYCHACAENPDGTGSWDAGVGCPSDGPGADGCEAVWVWQPDRPPTINLADLGFRYRVSDEARAEIEAAALRSALVLQTAHQYLFRATPAGLQALQENRGG